MKQSIWLQNTALPRFPALEQDIKTDILIIGGGLTGILCAYMLAQSGVNYVVIEADRVCHGVSGNTTAKITAQHGLVYHKLLGEFGDEKARMYWEVNQAALDQYRRLCREIPCDFEEKHHYVYATDSTQKLEKELLALEKIGHPAHFAEKIPLPIPTAGAVCFRNQGQFDPIKFVAGILPSMYIYENTPAQSFDGKQICTPKGRIKARKIIVATHFPLFNKHGSYYLKLYQHRSYVLALKNAPQPDGMYVDENKTGLSFRNYKNLLLLGGGGHRTGKKGGNWAELEFFAQRYYPTATHVCRWATQDCMSLDALPYIGQYAKSTPGLFVATGFNKWGMTSAMAAAMLLTDLVLEKENAYAPLFTPSRTILRPQLFYNALETTANVLTPTTPRCPHLGCALKWNPAERSWDCPCHGSRFSAQGKLLDNPANGDLKQR